jgi:hypothetical protein
MKRSRWYVAVAAWAWASAAAARGSGSGEPAWTPPETKSAGPAAEASHSRSRGTDFERGLGLFGGYGAAKDSLGPWRLGRYGGSSTSPSYGEAAQRGSGGGTTYEAWKSGDLVRSTSAGDVRAARMQQAPDLEWLGAPNRGQETYGKQFQHAQEKPRR